MKEINEKVIVDISDKYFGEDDFEMNNPKTRVGARGIVLRGDGCIAVFNKTAKNEYKLPGGGVDDGEDLYDAFAREVMEEVGCTIKDVSCIGVAYERKTHDNYMQKSYVFISRVDNDTKELHLTDKEKDEGAVLLWMKPEEAFDKIANCINNLVASKYENVYHTKFIVSRDKEILSYYINKISRM